MIGFVLLPNSLGKVHNVSTAAHLNLIRDLADIADGSTLDRFRTRDFRVEQKPDRTPVTDADLAVEDSLREVLAARCPDDVVAGEERGGAAGPGRTWLIDPIDGTKNFLRGVPAWATLIGLIEGGRPVAGMISAPALGRRWWAGAGLGAWTTVGATEPQRVSVSGVTDLADAYVSTTHLGEWVANHSRESYLKLIDACWENRAFGDFWHHCLVAEGAIDLAAEPIVNSWDVAAVQILVEEAGGTFTDLTGQARYDGGNALSSNGHLHDAALRLLRP